VRLGGEDAFGGRVSPEECIIYDGNTVKIIGSKIDGRKELDYLGRMGFFAYHSQLSSSSLPQKWAASKSGSRLLRVSWARGGAS
jgi:hypothetical protein